MDTILEVEGLTKSFPGFQLKGISFTLERGYIMGFIGRNGAGKTTTIKLIMNLIHRDGGSIRVFGEESSGDRAAVNDRIGFVYDEPCFYTGITVSETERVIAPFYSRWSREQYTRFVEKFRLEPQRKVGELSHGQRTLLSLAVAFSHDAELIIMDEPTSGLDPIVRSELIDLLYEIIQDERRSILFSTHITTDLEKIADHITFVDDGKILFSDSKDEILERYRIVRGPNAVLTDEARELCIGVRETPVGFEALSGASDELNALTGGRCIAERASLDDIMVSMVGRQIHVH